ncbi:SGNH/GDSL hydrolase family protein [Streptomyces triticirhizae]|uniref:SGNH/GDSL hydrolase family protein n=1 Tax=Streptomyces triticirhizae TaxID=2483353 RepID=A0A3M2LIS6_9ACTN|nr:SGNH/GDSL hydrolase family protein [Streptomyces triticirhizae]RMI35915.1 SGNH/GDSL hydrolase family protein [Streptomyces triticirhizae]
MKRTRTLGRLVALAALPLALLAGPTAAQATAPANAPAPAERSPQAAEGSAERSGPGREMRWVGSWTAMPQLTEPHNMPPPPFTGDESVLVDTTLRQTVRITTGGERFRLAFSNEFGGAPLPLTEVAVALPREGRAGVSAVEPGSSVPVTFSGGRSSVTVPIGARYVSDPVDLALPPGSNLTVTTYLAAGQATLSLTSHPGSRTTSHLLAGDHVTAEDLPGATPTDHWYLLSGVEAWSPADHHATAVLGDSLTDGRGSTTNGNDRWTDQLFDRMAADPDTAHVSLLNQGAGGNRVLNDGLGPSALARLDRDVIAQSGVERLILFEGVNDIGTAEATEEAQRAVADELITAFDQIVTRAHAHGIEVFGATLLPFGDNEMYDDPEGWRELARQTVNDWVRDSGRFDAVLDFDAATRDPAQPERLLPDIHDGDWLHLTPEGYGLLAASVPLELLR